MLAVKQGGRFTWYYILRDHLGSVTHLTDASGTVQNRYSYDAWGRRRSPVDWGYTLPPQTDLLPDRGFTGHENLKWFNLYNMNGRLYDPLVGRFLSPDNNVQMPDFSQNFNRYSYCLNNPLIYTDPSGELPFLATLAIVWAGNYAIGWLDNVINKGMSAKDAFKNTNFIMGVDFNPGDMSKQNNYGFTNSQVDAHNESKKDQERTVKVNKKLNDVRQTYGPSWHTSYRDYRDPYRYAKETYYGGMALGTMLYLADGPGIGPGDAAGAVYQTSTIVTASLMFLGTYTYLSLSGTTTSRGTPFDWNFDPEINRLQNDKYYPPGSKPPKWFWPSIGAAGAYELYKNWPKPNIPEPIQPTDNTYVAPRPIYIYPSY